MSQSLLIIDIRPGHLMLLIKMKLVANNLFCLHEDCEIGSLNIN